MGQIYNIACHDCEVRLWIGQTNTASKGKPWVYTGEPKTMKALDRFLPKHVGHKLEFNIDFAFKGRNQLEEGSQEVGYKEIV